MSSRRKPRVSKVPVTARVEKLSHDGRGLARIDGKATFIDGALAGELVTFEPLRKKRDFDEGRVLSVEEPSPDRVEPQCPHHGVCGGCSLQHLNPAIQLHEKETLVLDLLMRIGHLEPQYVAPALSGASIWHYRSRARLSVSYVAKKGRVLIGFREKHQGRYVADIHQCSILHEKVGTSLDALSELLGSMDNPDSFPQIDVAAGDDRVALVFRHLADLSEADKAKFRTFSDTTGFRIYFQPGGVDSVSLFYPEGDDMLNYALPEQKIKFSFYPTDFTQVNPDLNRKMVTQALDWLEISPDDVILDLFCGLGNFSLPLATRCARVMGVEGSDTMVERASANALKNNLTNTQFSCANLDDEEALLPLKQHGCNKLLIDPPRTGAFAIVKKIQHINPESILYVSCNPATFARDAAVLHEQGYRLEKLGVMDMFPHTTHVEVMGLFKRM
ncbi:MAG: 23S rRNA (uracil(1939)-C(5))-methyltransferase RlmD [Legionellaceae bacterium]|nr:23S rRNA (uracil(1939)-C(5))-methyltransferase RlmD [Legionellaceae bacterium]